MAGLAGQAGEAELELEESHSPRLQQHVSVSIHRRGLCADLCRYCTNACTAKAG